MSPAVRLLTALIAVAAAACGSTVPDTAPAREAAGAARQVFYDSQTVSAEATAETARVRAEYLAAVETHDAALSFYWATDPGSMAERNAISEVTRASAAARAATEKLRDTAADANEKFAATFDAEAAYALAIGEVVRDTADEDLLIRTGNMATAAAEAARERTALMAAVLDAEARYFRAFADNARAELAGDSQAADAAAALIDRALVEAAAAETRLAEATHAFTVAQAELLSVRKAAADAMADASGG